jgi:ATP-dependent helicase/nuclease subunit A
LEETGLLAAAAAESPAGAEAGNLLRAIDRVRQVVESGGGLADAARALEEDIDRGEVEAVPLEPARGDVVRLMNLHRAKGLEAPVVFLANPLAGMDRRVDVRIVREGGGALGYLHIRRRKGEHGWESLGEPDGWTAHQAAEDIYLQAEETRLLYVAATRAREILVIGRWAKTGGKTVRPWQPLDAYLAGVPELEVPAVASLPAPRAIDAGPELRAAAATARAARLAAACRPSWKVEAVTAGSTGPHAPAPVVRGVTGDGTADIDRGRDWGTLVHGLLEHAMRGPRREREYLEQLAAWLALDKPELQQVIPQALNTVERVMASDIWTRAMGAEERYAEVPFAVQLDGDDGVPVVVQGVIDLVYRTAAGWEAIDYKTDDPEGRLEALVATYRPQVTAYARHWGSLVGAPVRAGLFFVRSGAVAWLDGDA